MTNLDRKRNEGKELPEILKNRVKTSIFSPLPEFIGAADLFCKKKFQFAIDKGVITVYTVYI